MAVWADRAVYIGRRAAVGMVLILTASAGPPPEPPAGPHGWGLTYAWDAYQDGSVNPASAAYAIRTALGMQAQLDADTADQHTADVALAWGRFWSPGWYWYSDQPADAIDTPNSNAMLAGVTFRLVTERPDLFTAAERAAIEARADAAVRHLVSQGPVWPYSSRGGMNDARHAAYIGCGLMTYRAAGGSVAIPWTLPVGDRCSTAFP